MVLVAGLVCAYVFQIVSLVRLSNFASTFMQHLTLKGQKFIAYQELLELREGLADLR